MFSLAKIIVVLAGVSITNAAPLTRRNGLSFTLDQVARSTESVNIVNHYASAIKKHGGTPPVHIEVAAQSGSVGIAPSGTDTFYVVPVQLGQSTLHLSMDTGSSDLWVFSSHLPAEEAQGHTVYTPSVGVEKLEDYSFNISYAEGTTVTGDVYRDTVNISGIVAHNQAIEAATSVPASFVSQTSRDGIIGLGFSSINSIQPRAQKTFFETVQEQLASPVFAAALKHNAPGSFDFGYIDDAKFKGDAIHYTPVNNSNGMWTINTTGYSVDGGATSPKPLPLRAIVDTGTSVMMLPDDVVREYYAPIPGSDNNQAMGGWVFDCSSDLPDFHLVLLDDDYTAVVPGSLINYSPLGGSGNLCYGSIQEQGSLDMSVLGDPFLKSQYAVFDAGGMRMGFAPQA